MKRQVLRRTLLMAVAAACLAVVVWLFDWTSVWAALSRTRLGFFLSLAVPLALVSLLLRALRWLQVQDATFGAKTLWLSFLANAVSSGIGSFTPLQMGEAIKLRWIRMEPDKKWPHAIPAFIVERLMDLSGLIGVALAGLAVHFGQLYLVLPAISMPLLTATLLIVIARSLNYAASERWKPYIDVAHQPRRVFLAALTTIPIWISNTLLWWIAALAINVQLKLSHAFLLIGGATLASVASMVPGGLGVSELSSRGILLVLGYGQAEAEAVAVAVRLITALVLVLAALSGLAYAWHSKRSPR